MPVKTIYPLWHTLYSVAFTTWNLKEIRKGVCIFQFINKNCHLEDAKNFFIVES